MVRRSLPDRDYLCECFDYDPATGILIWRSRPACHFSRPKDCLTWNKRWAAKEAGFRQPGGHLTIRIDDNSYMVHRIIWRMMTGDEPPEEIDHQDRRRDNNMWANLRLATHVGNMQNSKRRSHSSTGLKGVYLNPHGGRFYARITSEGKKFYLGTFDTPAEAHNVYCEAAKRLHGKFWCSG